MARSKTGSKGPGYEYWSRRPETRNVGKKAKAKCHRRERAIAKRETLNELHALTE